jgi:hypothetical protein
MAAKSLLLFNSGGHSKQAGHEVLTLQLVLVIHCSLSVSMP